MKCVEVKVFLAPHVGNFFVLATWLLKHVHLSNRPLVNIQPNPFNDLTRQTVRLLSHKLYRSTLQRYEHRLESILVTISNQSSETHCNFSRAHMAPPSSIRFHRRLCSALLSNHSAAGRPRQSTSARAGGGVAAAVCGQGGGRALAGGRVSLCAR